MSTVNCVYLSYYKVINKYLLYDYNPGEVSVFNAGVEVSSWKIFFLPGSSKNIQKGLKKQKIIQTNLVSGPITILELSVGYISIPD